MPNSLGDRLIRLAQALFHSKLVPGPVKTLMRLSAPIVLRLLFPRRAEPVGVYPEPLAKHKEVRGNLELAVENPLASTIIPVYGRYDLLVECVRSLAHSSIAARLEVIVVYDLHDSNEPKPDLSTFGDIKILRQPERSGFGASCNLGASIATCETLIFLNTDVVCEFKALETLLLAFRCNRRVGLASGMLMQPDGKVQFHGGLILADGKGVNCSRREDPSLQHNRATQRVDYASGAALAVGSDLFKKVGGFDPKYGLGYCEDSDLSFKIREQGLEVISVPRAKFLHLESQSFKQDHSMSTSERIQRNESLFMQSWGRAVQNHSRTYMGTAVFTGAPRKKILVTDSSMPTVDRDAGSKTVLQFCMSLIDLGFEVHFLPLGNFFRHEPYAGFLEFLGIQVLHAPEVSTLKDVRLLKTSYSHVLIFRYENLEKLQWLIEAGKLPAPVVHAVDLHFLRESRSPGERSNQDLEINRERELEALSKAKSVIVHSSVEKEILQKALPNTETFVVPIADPVGRAYRAHDRDLPNVIGFLGNFNHPPNLEAAERLVMHLMPLIWSHAPEVKLEIAGFRSEKVNNLSSDSRVSVIGTVEDIDGWFSRLGLTCVPLLSGAGQKGKIVESLSRGVPVVSNAMGFEGMNLEGCPLALSAESNEEFASQVLGLLEVGKVDSSQINQTIEWVKTSFDPTLLQNALSEMLGLGSNRTALDFHIDRVLLDYLDIGKK